MYHKFVTYLKETRLEMRKVNWPTRAQSLRYTVTVIIASLAVSFILGAFDFTFTSLLQLFI